MRYALEVVIDGVSDKRMLVGMPSSVVLKLLSYTEEIETVVAEKVVL